MYRHTGKLIAVVALLAQPASPEVRVPTSEVATGSLRLEQYRGADRLEVTIEIECRPNGDGLFRVGPFDIAAPVAFEFDDSPPETCESEGGHSR